MAAAVWADHTNGTTRSASPWKSRPGASPALAKAPLGSPPAMDTKAPTAEENPGLPLVPGSSECSPTSVAVIAPAEMPPIPMRVASRR